MLEIRGLHKIYGKYHALSGLDMNVATGALYGFVGPNGAGKTTTIKIMTGLLPAEEGKITIDGMDALSNLKALKARIGYVPDFFGVYDNLTVSEYMEFFASCHHMDGLVARKRYTALLEQVGLEDKLDFYVDGLSRGMKQRLCLARALIHDPQILILDEPTNHMDIQAKETLESAFQAYEGTILFVSHDRYFIRQFATRIWMLEDGRITDFDGTFEEYRAWKEKKLAVSPSKKEEAEPKKERPRRTGGTKLLEKEVATAEREVARAEERMYDLTREIEDAASDYLKLTELYEQREALEEEIAHLYATWERLSAELEEVKAE